MKAKPLFLALVLLLAAGGLWLTRETWSAPQSSATSESTANLGAEAPGAPNGPKPDHKLQPPDPNRKFREMTPEQRVRLAKRGPIGG